MDSPSRDQSSDEGMVGKSGSLGDSIIRINDIQKNEDQQKWSTWLDALDLQQPVVDINQSCTFRSLWKSVKRGVADMIGHINQVLFD